MWTSKLGNKYPRDLIDRLDREHHRVLQGLRKLPANAHCAECGEGDTAWASVNLGVFVCTRCADVHRALGTHVSKVKGCSGTYLWGPDEISRMQEVGNAIAEADFGGDCQEAKPAQDATKEQRIELCKKKYETRLWAPRAQPARPTAPTQAAAHYPLPKEQAKVASVPGTRLTPQDFVGLVFEEDFFKDFDDAPRDLMQRCDVAAMSTVGAAPSAQQVRLTAPTQAAAHPSSLEVEAKAASVPGARLTPQALVGTGFEEDFFKDFVDAPRGLLQGSWCEVAAKSALGEAPSAQQERQASSTSLPEVQGKAASFAGARQTLDLLADFGTEGEDFFKDLFQDFGRSPPSLSSAGMEPKRPSFGSSTVASETEAAVLTPSASAVVQAQQSAVVLQPAAEGIWDDFGAW